MVTMLDCELNLIRNRWPAAKEHKSFDEFLRELHETIEISNWSLLNVTQEDAELGLE